MPLRWRKRLLALICHLTVVQCTYKHVWELNFNICWIWLSGWRNEILHCINLSTAYLNSSASYMLLNDHKAISATYINKIRVHNELRVPFLTSKLFFDSLSKSESETKAQRHSRQTFIPDKPAHIFISSLSSREKESSLWTHPPSGGSRLTRSEMISIIPSCCCYELQKPGSQP